MEALLTSISELIKEYREGEIGVPDEEHVGKWVSQFEESDRLVVLKETNRILRKTYISKSVFYGFISGLVENREFSSDDKRSFWSNVSLLDIQRNGDSQKEIVNILAECIKGCLGFSSPVNIESEHYIYADDFIFSGNRVVSDLSVWLENHAPKECKVSIVLMGWFVGGQWNVQNKLKDLARQHGKKVNFEFWSLPSMRLENRLYRKDRSHVFWPIEAVSSNPEVATYLKTQKKQPQYRNENGLKNEIFSSGGRAQYEEAMLKAGIKIISYCESPSPVVRPLGYSRFDGFGFGSTVFSFRNCPNNNPLAFWWGDSEASSSHPFSKWYPLLQRKTYG